MHHRADVMHLQAGNDQFAGKHRQKSNQHCHCSHAHSADGTHPVDVLHGFGSVVVKNAVFNGAPLSIETLVFQELLTLKLQFLQPFGNRFQLQQRIG